MDTELMSILLLGLLLIPVIAAAIVALMRPGQASLVRAISLGATLATLLLSLTLAVNFAELRVPQNRPLRMDKTPTFRPEFVPGAPGIKKTGTGKVVQDPHGTRWGMLSVGSASIQFYIGLDGLNIWLIVLTTVLMVPGVLVSWKAIQERISEYYAWLLLLETGMIGVFLAFDIILFYVFFELTLIPLFFLIGIWGGPDRRFAARKFFIYTLAGSIFTLLGLLTVVLACYHHPLPLEQKKPAEEKKLTLRPKELTFSIPQLVEQVNEHLNNPLDEEDREFWQTLQVWVFLAMAAGFSIKVPLVPLHTWLPLAHVEAPTAGSVLLAGVLLKIGTYGFLRLCLPLAPDASLAVGVPLIGILAVIGIIYGALCSYAQDDIKKLVAYSSVSHLGFCMLGMFALNETGISGSLLQMINHGLSTGALFLLVGMLYERYHTRKMSDYGGMGAKLHLLSLFMVFICLSSVGLPGLNGFVGEVLVFLGMADYEGSNMNGWVLAVVGASGIVLGAWYLLTMLRRVFFGPVKEPEHEGHGPVKDLNGRELAALVPIAALCVLIGVYPQPVLDVARRDINVVACITGQALERARLPAPLRSQPEVKEKEGGPR
jgi:NADH-quinone oxidoreductase subunit M